MHIAIDDCTQVAYSEVLAHEKATTANGKAERFIRTLPGGWAYGAIYRNSSERTAAVDGWLWHYNHQRRHSTLGHKPPIVRLNERTTLLGIYT